MADKIILQTRNVGEEAARLSRLHSESILELRRQQGMPDETTRQIFVRPSGGRALAMGGGQFYPPEGMFVSANDVYTARRLRDGSLEQTDPPAVPAEGVQPESQVLDLPTEEEMPLTREDIQGS
jgi:hypothetical protein